MSHFKSARLKLSNLDKAFIVFSNNTPVIEDYDDCITMPKDNVQEWEAFGPNQEISLTYDTVSQHMKKYCFPQQKNLMDSFAIFHDDLFQHICMSGLPVIARNQLSDEGISKNLFYEEILPRRSVLWFMNGVYQFSKINADSKADTGEYFTSQFQRVEDQLLDHNIQIGANASVGYGLTKIHKINGGKTHE